MLDFNRRVVVVVKVAVTAMSSKLAAVANKATATINTPLFSILVIIIIIDITVAQISLV